MRARVVTASPPGRTSAAAAGPEHAEAAREIPSFDDMYNQNWRYVASIAERLLLRRDEVSDVVQDVFLRAYRGRHQIENGAAIKGWLATITVRAVTDRLRRRKWQQLLTMDDSAVNEVPTPQAGPEEMAELRAVYAVLNRLPSKDRVAWTLRYVEQESLESVAALCGCSLATAKRRIAAAAAKLKALEGK